MTEVTKRTGSVCDVWAGRDRGTLLVQKTGRWSTHDKGSSPQLIPELGVSRTSSTVTSFLLARRAGIETHFIEQVSDDTILVREFEVTGKKPLSGAVHGRFIPLEHLYRSVVTKKLVQRVMVGDVSRASLGLDDTSDVHVGMDLPHLYHECTTKLRATDAYISDKDALIEGGITHEQLMQCRAVIGRASCVTTMVMHKAGYKKFDGKIEMGLDHKGRVTIVDCFATQDEDRIQKIGTADWYCKEILREELEKLPWFAELQEAKKKHPDNKSLWPAYPHLLDEIVEKVVTRYATFTAGYRAAAEV